ncbi:ATP-binding protein [Duganella sp. Leaf126]|uniref:hybrid sensor histidine kinase/response regulator n=1 Tax=Duganella sp. Leaf126 TaxID=1736266 RepID=UPI001E4B8D5A|nr:ATP-binding protein [Duganella sp. Leaf126]
MLTAIGLLPLALVGAWSIHDASRYQQREQKRLMLDLARALSSAADAELDSTVGVLTGLGRAPELQQGDLHAFYGVSRMLANTQPEWIAVMLADSTGKVLWWTADPIDAAPRKVADPDSLHAALVSRQPVVGRIVRGPRGQHAFPVRVPVITASGKLYILTAVVRPDRMVRLLDRQQGLGGALTAIRDSSQSVVARSRNQEGRVGAPPSASLIALMAEHGAEGVGIARTSEGQEMVTAYTTLSHFNWLAVVGRPAEQLSAASMQGLGLYGAGIAVSLLVCFGLASLLSARLVGTIGALQQNAAALGSGAPLTPSASSVTEVEQISQALALADAQRNTREHERMLLLDSLNQALTSHQAALAEAREAGRAKDEFLAVLGHELRNPLSPIVTSLDLLDLRNDPASQRERGVMRRQVEHLRRLVDDLLDVSRIISGKLQIDLRPVNLADVARHAVSAVADQSVSASLPPALWVQGDDSRLTQVLNNLLSNASRFGSSATHVSLTAEAEQARLVVSDNGIGMSTDLLARVFEPFQQAPQSLARRTGGLGLGLAIVRKIVELHGGQVTASSPGPGQGSRFEVLLPLAAPSELLAAHRVDAAQAGLQVLLVDDNVDAAAAGAELLTLMGHAVRTAHSGAAALAAVREAMPQVAILDIGLPDMDGYTLAAAIRAEAGGSAVRLVALTGYGQKEDVERAYAAGFDLHLTKPASLDDLQLATAERPR